MEQREPRNSHPEGVDATLEQQLEAGRRVIEQYAEALRNLARGPESDRTSDAGACPTDPEGSSRER